MIMPVDPTPEEIALITTATIILYSKLKDPKDKFIVAMHYELGYSKSDVAAALGISSPAVTMRDKKIKEILYKEAKSSHLVD